MLTARPKSIFRPTHYRTVRHTLYRILETSAGRRRGLSLIFNLVLISIITLNAAAIILHTVPAYNHKYEKLFYDFELFSVVFFTVEYILRIWVCVESEKYRHPVKGRIKYIFSVSSIIDFLAIFPFYFTLFAADLAIIRILRLFRIFRLFRVTRYSHAFRVIKNAVDDRKEELVLSMVLVVFMLIIVSSVMYYVEHNAQPDKFSSIPATMWWGVSAMTTVGYGDVHPITPLGKFLGGLAAIMGVGLFALPTGILVSGFLEHMKSFKPKSPNQTYRCPHCGKEF